MAANAASAALPHATGIFDTLVIVDEMPNAAEVNRTLRDAILARRGKTDGVTISNVGGWQSDRQMLQWGGEPANRLLARMIAAAERFTVDVAAPDRPRFRWAAEMWANVSPPHASNQYHTHPGAFWSAVYYVDDGFGGSDDRSLGGELVLQDPRMPMIMMTMPTLRFRRPGRPPDEPELAMRPVAGRIIMFPAWLNHCVMQYKGASERISIAANLSAVPLGSAP
jgi:uncharacterized protein (TIGR02466 family)